MEIKDNVYYVGVIEPNLRTFDILMKTEYGTSYNSYLIKDEHCCLIDTVPEDYFEEYLTNIQKFVSIQDIEYLVLNHTEPDHSGSVQKLLNMNPKIKIYCTMAASKNINNICNTEIISNIIKDDDILELGNEILRFKPAPFLHWPDSMFTYLETRKIVFTGDFLGAHFANIGLFDTYVRNNDIYLKCVKHYFNCIFSPFKSYVLSGISILNTLDYTTICPSHGPILEEKIDTIKQIYSNSSMSLKGNKVTIIYASAYGYTKALALAAKEYIEKNSTFLVTFIDVSNYDISNIQSQIESSKAILIGSPTINRDAVKPIWDILSDINVYSNKNLVAGVFGSYGWSGEATTMIINRLNSLGIKVIDNGFKVLFKPSENDIISMQEYTKAVIESVN